MCYYIDILFLLDITCPANSHYEASGPACVPSCTSDPECDLDEVIETCVCDSGFVMNDAGNCVDELQCGCEDMNGKMHYVS